MRMRNKPWAADYLSESNWVINEPNSLNGKWREEVFNNSNPLHLEVGMGKGGFILDSALAKPNINFLGLERFKSIHVYPVQHLEENYDENELTNMRQISADADYLTEMFDEGEIDNIYVNFPDPWPKKKHGKRRLVFRKYLELYYKILSEGGTVEFKTDQYALWEFAKEEVEEHGKFKITWETNDLHSEDVDNIKTEYETKFSRLGVKINKLVLTK